MRRLVAVVAACAIVLVRLPALVGNPTLSSPAVLCVFIGCIAWLFPRNTRVANPKAAVAALAFTGLVAVTVLRGARAGVYASVQYAVAESAMYLAVLVFAGLLVTTASDARERRLRLAALALAPAVYGLANAIMYLAGIEPATADFDNVGLGTYQQASLLAFLGIHIPRVQLPLATGVTTAGVVAGAGLAACVLVHAKRIVSIRLLVPLAAGCIFCLLWSDSRTSIVVVSLIVLWLIRKRSLGSVRWTAFALPGLPLYLVAVAAFLTGPLASVFSRSTNDLGTLDGRIYIWDEARKLISQPDIHQMFGWGAYGHVSSGLWLHYQYAFGSHGGTSTYTTHNLIIQTILDSGYIGVAVFVWALFTSFSALVAYADVDASLPVQALVSVVLICCISGATEVSPSYISQESLVAVLLVIGAAAGLGARTPAPASALVQRGHSPPRAKRIPVASGV